MLSPTGLTRRAYSSVGRTRPTCLRVRSPERISACPMLLVRKNVVFQQKRMLHITPLLLGQYGSGKGAPYMRGGLGIGNKGGRKKGGDGGETGDMGEEGKGKKSNTEKWRDIGVINDPSGGKGTPEEGFEDRQYNRARKRWNYKKPAFTSTNRGNLKKFMEEGSEDEFRLDRYKQEADVESEESNRRFEEETETSMFDESPDFPTHLMDDDDELMSPLDTPVEGLESHMKYNENVIGTPGSEENVNEFGYPEKEQTDEEQQEDHIKYLSHWQRKKDMLETLVEGMPEHEKITKEEKRDKAEFAPEQEKEEDAEEGRLREALENSHEALKHEKESVALNYSIRIMEMADMLGDARRRRHKYHAKRFATFEKWKKDRIEKYGKKNALKREQKKVDKKTFLKEARNSPDWFYYSEINYYIHRDQLENPVIRQYIPPMLNNPTWTNKQKRQALDALQRYWDMAENYDPETLKSRAKWYSGIYRGDRIQKTTPDRFQEPGFVMPKTYEEMIARAEEQMEPDEIEGKYDPPPHTPYPKPVQY